jgi:hypothetical protein
MSSVDDAVYAKGQIDKIVALGMEQGSLTMTQNVELNRLFGVVAESRWGKPKAKTHEAFCSYFDADHEGPCNPSNPADTQRFVDAAGELPETYRALLSEPRTDLEPTPEGDRVADARYFPSGAYRDGQDGKLDYEGFLSPAALLRYAEYMDANRLQSDGVMRDSDNWQQGIPVNSYMKSMWRHFIDAWTQHRKTDANGYNQDALETSLCAVIFNAFGYLHELRTRGGHSDSLSDNEICG